MSHGETRGGVCVKVTRGGGGGPEGQPRRSGRARRPRQDRAGLANTVQFGKDVLLQLHVLDHRLHDHVHVPQVVIAQGRFHQTYPPGVFRLRDLALARAHLPQRLHSVEPRVQRLLVHLHEVHGDARGREAHSDAAPHRATSDHCRGLHTHRLGRGARDFEGGALRKEDVLQRLGLGGYEELLEDLGLLVQALGQKRLGWWGWESGTIIIQTASVRGSDEMRYAQSRGNARLASVIGLAHINIQTPKCWPV